MASARRHGDPAALMGAAQCALIYEEDPFAYVAIAREVCDLASSEKDMWAYCYARGSLVRGLMRLGSIDDARDKLPELREAAERGQFVLYRYQAMVFDVIFAIIDGRFDDAEQLAERASAFGSAARTEFDAGVYGVQMYAIRREQGRLEEVAPACGWRRPCRPTTQCGGLAWRRCSPCRHARRRGERVRRAGGQRLRAVPRDATWPGSLTYLAEVCTALGDVERAAVLYATLDAFAGQTMQVGFTVNLGPADRFRGNLAALLGRPDDAARHFDVAYQLTVVARAPAWRARVAHDWAVACPPMPDLLPRGGGAGVRARHVGARPQLPRGVGARPARRGAGAHAGAARPAVVT